MSKNYLLNLININYDFVSDLIFLLNSEKAIIYIIKILTY